jgi:peptidyl-tRNA hydrolase
MKYLIVGLGNIGPTYDHTRHNIGFSVLDILAKDLGIEFSLQKLAIVGEGRLKNKQGSFDQAYHVYEFEWQSRSILSSAS